MLVQSVKCNDKANVSFQGKGTLVPYRKEIGGVLKTGLKILEGTEYFDEKLLEDVPLVLINGGELEKDVAFKGPVYYIKEILHKKITAPFIQMSDIHNEQNAGLIETDGLVASNSTINSDLIVHGKAKFTDTMNNGQLKVGGNFFCQGNSVANNAQVDGHTVNEGMLLGGKYKNGITNESSGKTYEIVAHGQSKNSGKMYDGSVDDMVNKDYGEIHSVNVNGHMQNLDNALVNAERKEIVKENGEKAYKIVPDSFYDSRSKSIITKISIIEGQLTNASIGQVYNVLVNGGAVNIGNAEIKDSRINKFLICSGHAKTFDVNIFNDSTMSLGENVGYSKESKGQAIYHDNAESHNTSAEKFFFYDKSKIFGKTKGDIVEMAPDVRVYSEAENSQAYINYRRKLEEEDRINNIPVSSSVTTLMPTFSTAPTIEAFNFGKK